MLKLTFTSTVTKTKWSFWILCEKLIELEDEYFMENILCDSYGNGKTPCMSIHKAGRQLTNIEDVGSTRCKRCKQLMQEVAPLERSKKEYLTQKRTIFID